MSFAANLEYIKDTLKLSNYKLAKAFGCSQSSIKNWIEGKNIPHPSTRQKIADHFGITMAELDGDELPVLPPEGGKKEIASGVNAEGDDLDMELKEIWASASKDERQTLLGMARVLRERRK